MYHAGLVVVVYLADQACTDLDLRHRAEVFRLKHAVLTGVLLEHRVLVNDDWLHGMIAPLDVIVAAFKAVVYITVAVIIFNAEP